MIFKLIRVSVWASGEVNASHNSNFYKQCPPFHAMSASSHVHMLKCNSQYHFLSEIPDWKSCQIDQPRIIYQLDLLLHGYGREAANLQPCGMGVGSTEAGVGKCPAMSACFKPDLDKNEELLRVKSLTHSPLLASGFNQKLHI